MLRDRAAELGLVLNIGKCEIIGTENDQIPPIFAGFRRFSPSQCELLGRSTFEGEALDAALAARCADLARASLRLRLLDAHDALLILTHSLSAPKMFVHPQMFTLFRPYSLVEFDHILRRSLSMITNVEIDDLAWVQASLPVADGGLGVRSVALLAPSAFLASAAATLDLQTQLLPHGVAFPDKGRDLALSPGLADTVARSQR